MLESEFEECMIGMEFSDNTGQFDHGYGRFCLGIMLEDTAFNTTGYINRTGMEFLIHRHVGAGRTCMVSWESTLGFEYVLIIVRISTHNLGILDDHHRSKLTGIVAGCSLNAYWLATV